MKITEEEKEIIKNQLSSWVTPQITPTFEPICVAQKPKDGTFLSNFLQYGVGLLRKGIIKGSISCAKPKKMEKGIFNDHVSVKPLDVIEKLILAFSQENQWILDPFMGSGTTALAAKRTHRQWLGFEKELKYYEIATQRLAEDHLSDFFKENNP